MIPPNKNGIILCEALESNVAVLNAIYEDFCEQSLKDAEDKLAEEKWKNEVKKLKEEKLKEEELKKE